MAIDDCGEYRGVGWDHYDNGPDDERYEALVNGQTLHAGNLSDLQALIDANLGDVVDGTRDGVEALTPEEMVDEADRLFHEGMRLMRRARGEDPKEVAYIYEMDREALRTELNSLLNALDDAVSEGQIGAITRKINAIKTKDNDLFHEVLEERGMDLASLSAKLHYEHSEDIPPDAESTSALRLFGNLDPD